MTAALNTGKPEKFSTEMADFWLGEDGIMRKILHKGAKESFDSAKDGMKIMLDLSGGIKRPLLIDMRGMKSFAIEARRYYAEECPKYFSVIALLVGSRLTKTIGNFFLKVNRPAADIEIFTDENRALEWLAEHAE